MAHIFAAMDDGPRANTKLLPEERGDYNNLILLCVECHTLIDKAPELYPDQLIRAWKWAHAEKLAATFGIAKFESREALRAAISPLLQENFSAHKLLGPDNEYRFNPEAAEADTWIQRVRSTIIPNSNRIIRYIDANLKLLRPDEIDLLGSFKVHVEGLIQRHIIGATEVNIRFPVGFEKIAE